MRHPNSPPDPSIIPIWNDRMRRMLKLLLFAVVLFASTPIGAGGANMNRSEWVLTKEISLGTYVIQIHGHQFHQADGTVFHCINRILAWV